MRILVSRGKKKERKANNEICIYTFNRMLVTYRVSGLKQGEYTSKQINIEPDFINFSGKWHSLTPTPYFIKLPKVNAVSGYCSKKTTSCKEMVALLYNPKTDKTITHDPMIDVQEYNYQIIEWSPSVILARAEYPVADIELRISPLDKSIERTYRETKKRGSETSDPNIVNSYILR